MAQKQVATPSIDVKVRKQPANFIFRQKKTSHDDKRNENGSENKLYLSNCDTVLFNFGTETDEDFRPRQMRYISSSKSIWVDEQHMDEYEKHKMVLDNPENRERLIFARGEIRVPSYDGTRKYFLSNNSQCENIQDPKVKRMGGKMSTYEMLDFGFADAERVRKGQSKEKAYELAKTAREKEMLPHAKQLGITFTYPLTGEEKDSAAIREDYKDYALQNPEVFLKGYNDPVNKVRYAVKKLVESGEIVIDSIAKGQAHWRDTQSLICVIPEDKQPLETVTQFALTDAGADFLALIS